MTDNVETDCCMLSGRGSDEVPQQPAHSFTQLPIVGRTE